MSESPKKIPTQKRSQETVNAILEATQKIISESGIDSFNTNLVAKIAGVSIGSLYQYFPNKESVFTAFILSRTAKDVERFRELMQQTTYQSSQQLVSAVVDYLIQLSKGRSAFQRTILEHLPSKLRLEIQLQALKDLDGILKQNLEARQGRPLNETQALQLYLLTRSLLPLLAFTAIEDVSLLDNPSFRRQLEKTIQDSYSEFFVV